MILKSNRKLEQFIAHHKEYKDLIMRVEDMCQQASILNSFKSLYFVNKFEQEVIDNYINHYNDLECIFITRIEDSERKLAIILPKDSYHSTKTSLLKIVYPIKYETLSHRDILGTLLSLGINRNCIGDIIDNKDCIYIETTSDLTKYIIDNLERIKKVKIKISETSDQVIRVQEYQSKNGFVKSFRLDNIVKLITNKSNQETREYLLSNNVKINQIVKSDFSYLCRNGDELSLRGYGRFKLIIDLNRKSKKDNYFITYDKYL